MASVNSIEVKIGMIAAGNDQSFHMVGAMRRKRGLSSMIKLSVVYIFFLSGACSIGN